VNVPADLAGVKLRMPGSKAWQFLGNALGANATPLAFEEVYLAMQTGTIDGLENPLPDAISAKFYEVSKQVILTGHQVANIFFTIAKPFWDSLSDEERAAILAAEDAAKKLNDDGVLATEADGKAFFEKNGNTVTAPDVAAFRTQVLDKFLNSEFAKSWPPGLLDRINAAGA
jgi:TRAP-type C4-dicarboxylate transport system substrate-binding protein